ncbi:MAG: hypothetical protein GX241_03755 [Ruminococcaceae bacterium]|nr:hypothetical protein [Oscillospiraceae bacterium]
MKKLIYGIIATIIVLSIGVSSAFALNTKDDAIDTSKTENTVVAEEIAGEVLDEKAAEKVTPAEEAKDKVAAPQTAEKDTKDKAPVTCPNGGIRKLDGTGKQNRAGFANKGANFVDKDDDGICDNKVNGKCAQNGESNNHCQNNSEGNRNRHRATNTGRNFVDKNGDGICDNK